MNRFSMDYSSQTQPGQPPHGVRKPIAPMRWRRLAKRGRALRGYVLGGLLLSGTALVMGGATLRQLHADNERLRVLHDLQRLRYDSLLSAKLEADRRLHRLLKTPAPSNPGATQIP